MLQLELSSPSRPPSRSNPASVTAVTQVQLLQGSHVCQQSQLIVRNLRAAEMQVLQVPQPCQMPQPEIANLAFQPG